jgi:DNA primase
VRERSPIEAVVGDYVQLRNAGGGGWKALCPFHDEKSPSFNVSNGLWHCFGCQEGGDAISFVQKIESLSFAEAVERLAAKAGVHLRYAEGGYTSGRQQGERTRLVEAHRAAAAYYVARLSTPEAGAGRRFLGERGFGPEHAARFGIGYAPRGWENLVGHMRSKGFTDKELLAAGLASPGRKGPIDRFRGRLVWPIRDMTGNVIAFGARKLDPDDDGPKYLNTPETPIFKKGSVLYGMDLAKKEIARRRQVVIVEGYTDVMACHLSDVPTAVATCGTSFGDEHIKLVRRLLLDQDEQSGEVIFTFDGDEAGQRAALRAFDHEQQFVTQTFVAVQTDGLDPCDLRMKRGEAAVRDLVAGREHLYEFAIRTTIERFDVSTAEGTMAALRAVAPIVARIKDSGIRRLRIKDLDRRLGTLDEQFVIQEVENAMRGHSGARGRDHAAAGGSRPERRAAPTLDPRDPVVIVEREVLKLAVQRPALLGPQFDALPAGAFTAPDHVALFELIQAAGGVSAQSGGPEWVARLLTEAPHDGAKSLITSLGVDSLHTNADSADRYAAAHLVRIRELLVTREIARVKSKLGRLNPVTQADEYNPLFGDLAALEQQRRMLRERMISDL